MLKATFAAGCFWGVEAVYRKVEGVVSTSVGYTGGMTENPTYEQVCSGQTGHAEAVQITYDPELVSYDDLLQVFWDTHDPTTLNKQGPDVGTHYRSAIFFHDEDQEEEARVSKQVLSESGQYSGVIVTEIGPATTFWKAEEYHQQYFERNGIAHC